MTTRQDPPTFSRHAGNSVTPAYAFRPIQAKTAELIGINEAVAQNQHGASETIALRDANASGEILSVMLEMVNAGTGGVIAEDGKLILFNADPAVAVADADLAAGEGVTIIGTVDVAAADWQSETAMAYAFKAVSIPFEALANLYVAYLHKGATTFNDAAGDDEKLTAVIRYREDT